MWQRPHCSSWNKLIWNFSFDLKYSKPERGFSFYIKPFTQAFWQPLWLKKKKKSSLLKCQSLSGYNSLRDHKTYSCSAQSYKSPWRPCWRYQCDPVWYLFLSLPLFYLTDWLLSLLAGRGTFGEAVADSIFSCPANGLFPCIAVSHPGIRARYNWPHTDPCYPLSYPWQPCATSGHRNGARASVSDDTGTWGAEWTLAGTLCWSRGRSWDWCNC